jgi:hypothetical protein
LAAPPPVTCRLSSGDSSSTMGHPSMTVAPRSRLSATGAAPCPRGPLALPARLRAGRGRRGVEPRPVDARRGLDVTRAGTLWMTAHNPLRPPQVGRGVSVCRHALRVQPALLQSLRSAGKIRRTGGSGAARIPQAGKLCRAAPPHGLCPLEQCASPLGPLSRIAHGIKTGAGRNLRRRSRYGHQSYKLALQEAGAGPGHAPPAGRRQWRPTGSALSTLWRLADSRLSGRRLPWIPAAGAPQRAVPGHES